MGQACVGEPPHHQLGADISAGQGQGTSGTTTEGGAAHPDDTISAEERFDWERAGEPKLVDHIEEETGREGHRFSPTCGLQLHSLMCIIQL